MKKYGKREGSTAAAQSIMPLSTVSEYLLSAAMSTAAIKREIKSRTSAAVRARCRAAVCYGEAGARIAAALEAPGAGEGGELALDVVRAPRLRDAFAEAARLARPGDVVLLSPACSSFDEFSNMAERGRLFKALVAELAERGA